MQRGVRTEARLWRRLDLEAGEAALPEWAHRAFRRFGGDVESSAPLFPCVFGVEAFREDGLRFVFVEGDEDPGDLEELAQALAQFVRRSRGFGRYVSLVAFFAPQEEDRELADWEQAFWRVLQLLHDHDVEPWPDEIPMDPEQDYWEFCFAGTPMFVVCNTPSHGSRSSSERWHRVSKRRSQRNTSSPSSRKPMPGSASLPFDASTRSQACAILPTTTSLPACPIVPCCWTG